VLGNLGTGWVDYVPEAEMCQTHFRKDTIFFDSPSK